LGTRVRIICQEKVLEGYAMDIENSGALVLRTDAGTLERILAGDVVRVK
jgi:BirA family biotin operon repressor/biotin-[acetyl-CoA-carboxylase] ligase